MLTRSRRPFIIDLDSTNGTQVNDEQIPESRYYELKLGDGAVPLAIARLCSHGVFSAVIKFGESQREYVLLHDEAA